MKKKFIAVFMVIALAVTSIVGGTLAYFTDTDGDVNVMTIGNVSIKQLEYERVVKDGNWVASTVADKYGYYPDELQPFENHKPLYPVVTENGIMWDDRNGSQDPSGAGSHQQSWGQIGASGSNQLFDDSVKNAIDKFVFVENDGKNSAYVRTWFAFEQGDIASENFNDVIMTNGNKDHWSWETVAGDVEIDGNNYVIFVATYLGAMSKQGTPEEGILPAGTISYPSLLQVYMKSDVTQEQAAAIDGNDNGLYEILVFSQAAQTEGFANAKAALDEAFGEATTANIPWVSEGQPTFKMVKASNVEELKAAVEDATIPTVITLDDGEYVTNFKIPSGKDITITGSKDVVLSGQIAATSNGTLTLNGVTVNVDDKIVDSTGISQTKYSAIAIWGDQDVICENVTFNCDLDGSTAITAYWSTGAGANITVKNCVFNCNGERPIRSDACVTVEGCTFNDPYRYAVQLTAKAGTASELDNAIINFYNNTINGGAGGKDVVYGIQLEGETYGCNDLIINGSDNVINLDASESSGAMYYCECGKVDHDSIVWHTEVAPVHAAP